MYFASRVQAGRMLAARLTEKYRYENCVVVVLNDGGAVVGIQIAAQLHCALSMILTSEITLPREPEAIGTLTAAGNFAYSSDYSSGEIEEIQDEYRGVIEAEKLTKLHEMNSLLGSGGLVRKDLLRGHNVILVADALFGTALLDAAETFLKPIAIDRLVVATPLANVAAIDKIHVMADEIQCLSVIEDNLGVNHYYSDNALPEHDKILKTIENIVLHWQ